MSITTPTAREEYKAVLRAQYAETGISTNGTAYFVGCAQALVDLDAPRERIQAALELVFEEYKAQR